MKLWCLNGDNNHIPHINGEVYWLPWDVRSQSTANDEHFVLPKYIMDCKEENNGNAVGTDLHCGPRKNNG